MLPFSRHDTDPTPPGGGRLIERSGLRGKPIRLRSVPFLVGSMTILGLLLVGGTFLVETTAIRSRTEVNQMLENALPSTDHLSTVDARLGRIDELLDRNLVQLSLHQRVDWRGISAARTEMLDAFEAYRALPAYEGELDLQGRVLVDLARLDVVLAGVQSAMDRGDLTAAQALNTGAWSAARSDVGAHVRDLMVFNLRHAVGHASSLDVLWHRLALLSGALALVLLFLGTATTRMATRAVAHQLRFEAERAAELELFADRVAHDVLSPISSTHMALRALVGVEDARVQTLVKSATHSLDRARSVVEGLMRFATSGGRPRPGQWTSVPEAFGGAFTGLSGEANAKGIELLFKPPPDTKVACAPEILDIILSNLVRNAIKFMDPSTVRRIEISALPDEAGLRFQVQDTGPGLPPGFESEAFEPYARGRDDRPGLGLGLATVKRLTEAHGGRAGLRSAGHGTVVWFTLPLFVAEPRRLRAHPQAS